MPCFQRLAVLARDSSDDGRPNASPAVTPARISAAPRKRAAIQELRSSRSGNHDAKAEIGTNVRVRFQLASVGGIENDESAVAAGEQVQLSPVASQRHAHEIARRCKSLQPGQ